MDEEMAELPSSPAGQRSCLRCGLIKNYNQFYENGCDNCQFLELQERTDRVDTCTTADFAGMIAMVRPQDSWVAQTLGLTEYLPGIYALHVYGELPASIREYMVENDITSRAASRDTQ